MADYYCLTTDIGNAKLTNALALGLPVVLTHMAVGDGNGAVYNPAGTQTALAREVHRAPINAILQDEDNPGWLIVECVIPAAVGGWYVREAGIFDDDGDMIAIAKLPESYKAALDSGAGDDLYIRLILQHTNVSQVQLKIDPSVVLATRSYVDDRLAAHEAATDPHPQYATDADLAQLHQVIGDDIAAAVEAVDTSVPAATTDASGIVELATEAEAAALTDASRVITPAALGALFGRSLGASGYQMFPGGMIMQWGYVSGLSSAPTQVTFPMAFPSSCDALVFGNKGFAVQPNSAEYVTLTGFTLYSTASGDSAWWVALGR